MDFLTRTRLLVGSVGLERLGNARVSVFGLGGVGAHAAEALARAGVGNLTLVDYDRVVLSNLNRQLLATQETLGQLKTEVMAARLRSINPGISLTPVSRRFDQDSADELLAYPADIVVDAIDTLSFKARLIEMCMLRQQPIITSMGAGGKLDPSRVRLADLFETRGCPLARMVRKRLRRRGVGNGVPAVYSDESPILPPPAPTSDGVSQQPGDPQAQSPPGTISYMPAIFGMHCAAYVIRWLLRDLDFPRRGSAGKETRHS